MTTFVQGLDKQYFDGRLSAEAARSLEAHSNECSSCREESSRYRQWKERFGGRESLPATTPCPAPGVKSAYAAGTLQAPGRAEVVEHLSRCHSCREEWIEIRGLLAEESRRSKAPTPPTRHRFALRGSSRTPVISLALNSRCDPSSRGRRLRNRPRLRERSC